MGELGLKVRFVDWEVGEEVVGEGMIPPDVLVHLESSVAEAAELQRRVQQRESPKNSGMREATAEEAFDSERLGVPWKYISPHEMGEEH